MKKVISLILILCMAISAVPAMASDAEGTWHSNTWRLEGNTLYVSNAEGYIFGHTVITSESYKQTLAEEYADVIEEVVFEEGATVIEDCLLGLDKVHTVYIPSTATKLYIFPDVNFVVDEENAFYSSLDGVLFNKDKTTLITYPKHKTDMVFSLPESVTKIEASAFNQNKHIKTVIFNENLVEICDYAFKECDNLGSISLPDSVKKIGKEAFLSCDSLTSAHLGCVEEIGREAFRYTNIKILTIPKTLKKMDIQAFMFNDALTSVTIEEGVEEISSQAFAHCISLEEVSIPDSVTSIASNAFFGTKLKQLDDALYIGEKLLSCTASGSYTVKEGTRFIANGAFKESHVTHVNLPDSMEHIDAGAFSGAEELESVKMPETITGISMGAFNDTKLKSIYIGKNVKYIAPGVFNNCDYLEEIIVHEDNQYFASVDGVLYNKDKTQIITYPNNKKDAEFTVPETACKLGNLNSNDNIKKLILPISMTIIPEGFCADCESLTEVVFGENVTQIGINSFRNCKNLTDINLPEGLEIIGHGAFEGTAINKITLPESVRKIGGRAFYESRQLTDITIGNNVTEVGDYAFAFCSALEKISLPDSVQSVGYGAIQGCGMLSEVYIGGGEIGDYTFMADISLEKVTLGDNVKNISIGMFEGCTSLKEVEVGNGVTTIGEKAFDNCTGLEKLSLGKNVGEINASFFWTKNLLEITLAEENEHFTLFEGVLFTKDMTTLVKYPSQKSGESYSIPPGVKTLGEASFHDAVNLKEVIIPEGVEVIGRQAFESCLSLEEIVIPKSVKTMEFDAVHVTSLKACYYMGTENDWNQIDINSNKGDLADVQIIFNYVPIKVTVNNAEVNCAAYGQQPYIKNDRTLVPMRAIFEALGAEVSWDDTTKTAIGVKDDVEVKITIGENVLYKNGDAIELDCAAEITNNRTMVPVRAISEAFGCTVNWDNDTKTVEITH